MFTAGQPRVDQIGEKLGKLNLEKPCKDMCKRIRGTSRSKIPRTQKIEGPIKIRSGGKRRFGRMCKKTCMTKAKEKIRRSISKMKRLEKERKTCKKILSRRHAQGHKGQRQKTQEKEGRKRKELKCRIKSRRQGRMGCSVCGILLGIPLFGIGGIRISGILGGFGLGGLGLGLGTGLGTGFRINTCQNVYLLGPGTQVCRWPEAGPVGPPVGGDLVAK